MENQPQNIIAIGRKRFPIEEIALVEPFACSSSRRSSRLRRRVSTMPTDWSSPQLAKDAAA
jgi:hypothetical protein